jgi:hypothetical protein
LRHPTQDTPRLRESIDVNPSSSRRFCPFRWRAAFGWPW